jgi:hypothetical protein
MPYRQVGATLREFLPVREKSDHVTVRNRALRDRMRIDGVERTVINSDLSERLTLFRQRMDELTTEVAVLLSQLRRVEKSVPKVFNASLRRYVPVDAEHRLQPGVRIFVVA